MCLFCHAPAKSLSAQRAVIAAITAVDYRVGCEIRCGRNDSGGCHGHRSQDG